MTLPYLLYNEFVTKIIFAENQLSLTLIGLSPLNTNHPRLMQQSRVRST